ncbi:hypothetical protein ACFVH4_02930 [Nocardia ignorata]|uniref:hypothetical protein n=1 Tax=Nocardia ignorata TaxID=145285 RepID=UPI003626401A
MPRLFGQAQVQGLLDAIEEGLRESFADLLEWENSTIHEVPGMATTYRLLRNPDGDIGWTDTHNGRIMPYR